MDDLLSFREKFLNNPPDCENPDCENCDTPMTLVKEGMVLSSEEPPSLLGHVIMFRCSECKGIKTALFITKAIDLRNFSGLFYCRSVFSKQKRGRTSWNFLHFTFIISLLFFPVFQFTSFIFKLYDSHFTFKIIWSS